MSKSNSQVTKCEKRFRRGRAGHRVELDKCAVGCEGLVKLKFGSGDVVEAECA